MSSASPGCSRVGPGVWGRTKRNLIAVVSICSLALMLGAAPALAQVQNLCLLEIDGIVTPDDYGNISTEEACNLDQTQAGAPTGNNDSWGDIISAASVPNPKSGTGTGGTFSGVLETVNDQFTQGASSKLGSGINTWVYKIAPGGPSKADLQQGAVATFTYTQSPPAFSSGPATGDEILYYLVTRATNNGSELHGVWLFLGPVAETDPSCTSKCTFTGNHTNGDLFLLSGFTGGGGTVTIQVFQWSCSGTGATCDATGSLTHVATGACSTGGSGFECGEVNDESLSVPASLPNPNTGQTLDTGLFFNGGVDINSLFSGTTPCFSSVMFESVASASCSTDSLATSTCTSIGNAASKFFIFGNFNTCSIDVNKECGAGTANSAQTAIKYPIGGLVSNGDGGTVTLSSITDSPSFDSNSLECFPSTQSFNGTSCTASKDACIACEEAVLASSAGAPTPESCSNVSLTAKGTAGGAICYGASLTQSTSTCVGAGCTDTVTATATGPGGSIIPSKKAMASCSFTPVAAGLNVTKNCAAGLVATGSALEVKVNTGYLVCNEQPALLSNVTLTDNEVASANISKVSGGITCPGGGTGLCLAPEGQTGDCATFTGSYVPTSLSQISGIGVVPACTEDEPSETVVLTNPTQDFLADTATATGQCNSNVCNSSSTGCTVSGTTVTCTAQGGASCPLCPLQNLGPATPPTSENPD